MMNLMYHFVINNKNIIPYMTIREFAGEVHSSPTSVLRFCKKVGCDGFLEFKVCFKQMLENEQSRISYSDDKVGLFRDFLAKVETPAFVEKLKKAVQLIRQRDKLFCVGAGPTGSIAFYAATHLSAAGHFATYIDDYSMLTAPRLSDDVYMLFCVSGESKEMVEFAGKIKESGGKSLVITNSDYTTLSKLADFVLPYDIYYLKNTHHKPSSFEETDEAEHLADDLSTQLPVSI